LVSVPPSFAQLSVKDGQELGPCQLGEQHLILGVEAGADSVGFWLVNIVLCERGGVTEKHPQRSRPTASRSRTTSDDWRRARKAAYSGRIVRRRRRGGGRFGGTSAATTLPRSVTRNGARARPA